MVCWGCFCPHKDPLITCQMTAEDIQWMSRGRLIGEGSPGEARIFSGNLKYRMITWIRSFQTASDKTLEGDYIMFIFGLIGRQEPQHMSERLPANDRAKRCQKIQIQICFTEPESVL